VVYLKTEGVPRTKDDKHRSWAAALYWDYSRLVRHPEATLP